MSFQKLRDDTTPSRSWAWHFAKAVASEQYWHSSVNQINTSRKQHKSEGNIIREPTQFRKRRAKSRAKSWSTISQSPPMTLASNPHPTHILGPIHRMAQSPLLILCLRPTRSYSLKPIPTIPPSHFLNTQHSSTHQHQSLPSRHLGHPQWPIEILIPLRNSYQRL